MVGLRVRPRVRNGVEYSAGFLQMLAAHYAMLQAADAPGGPPILGAGSALSATVKLVGKTSTEWLTDVPLVGQLAYDTTSGGMRLGDGSTAGGLPFELNSERAVHVKPRRTDAASGTAWLAGLARAKALTPGGSAISATNPAYFLFDAGYYDIGNTAVDFNVSGLHSIGIRGSNFCRLILGTGSPQLIWSVDNTTFQGCRIVRGSSSVLGRITAAANSGLVHRDLYWDAIGGTTVLDTSGVTTWDGLYEDIRTNLGRCYHGASGVTVAATFRRCNQLSGTDQYCWGSNTSTITYITGSGRWEDCVWRNSCTMTITGKLIRCYIHSNTAANNDCIRLGSAGEAYANHLFQNGTADCFGASGAVTVKSSHNRLNAGGGLAYDANITNSLTGNDLSSTSVPEFP